jgi:hypothetical protein
MEQERIMEDVWADATRQIIDAFLNSDSLKHWWWFVAILELAAQTWFILSRQRASSDAEPLSE